MPILSLRPSLHQTFIRRSVRLSFPPSHCCPSLCPSNHRWVRPSSIRQSVGPSFCPSHFVCPSLRLTLCSFVCPFLCLSLRRFDRLSFRPFVRLSVRPFLDLPVCPSARPSVHPSINQWISYEYFQIVLDHSHYRLFFKQQYRSFRIAHGLPSRPQCQRVTVKPVICCVWVNFTFSKTSLTYFRSCLLRWEWWDDG